MYAGPQSHYNQRTIKKKRVENRQDNFRQEDGSKEKVVLRGAEARNLLRNLGKEFGRTTSGTKQRVGTLPLVPSTIQQIFPLERTVVADMTKALQAFN